MVKFKFFNFEDNLLDIEGFVENKDKTIVVYPSKNNANRVQGIFQKNWQFEDILFFSMEELKNIVLATDKSLLADDKRVVALYQVLTDEDKKYFNVSDFFDFIILANKIFSLFEELSEEMVDSSTLLEELHNKAVSLFEWQEDYFTKVLDLLTRYRESLKERGYADRIFFLRQELINISSFAKYERIYFVNQFYYTGLERKIINLFHEQGKELTLCYQIPEKFVDKETLSCLDFSFSDIKDLGINEKVEVHVCKNEFTMLNSLCGVLNENKVSQIIDKDFYEKSYSQILSKDKFSIGYSQPISSSALFHFFSILNDLLNNYEYYNNRYYIPTYQVIKAFLNPQVVAYFELANSRKLVDELNCLLDNGFLYLDKNLSLEKIRYSSELKESIQKILTLVEKVSKINSMNNLIELIDNEEGIIIDKLCTSYEKKYSNLREVFYTELANLKSFNFNDLISDWSELSSKASHLIIYKLFYDGLKSKKISYKALDRKSRIRINSLLDTRNNSYDSVAFLNMVEGEFPKRRSSQFIFNEKQREVIGLKSYEDIRLREKYYFYRLLLTSKEVYLFTIVDLDENTEMSSYIEEMAIDSSQYKINTDDMGYSQLLKNDVLYKKEINDEFFKVKISQDSLTAGSGRLDLSYTQLSHLIENPFNYLVSDYAGLRHQDLYDSPKQDFRFIGILTQDYINHIVSRINQTFPNEEVYYKFQFLDEKYLSQVFDSLMSNYPNQDFKIPHNYSKQFINKVFRDLVIEGMKHFFNRIMHSFLNLSEHKIKLIPEGDFMTKKEQAYRDFIESSRNDYGLNIGVRGKADLRIESLENDRKWLVDFKTGNYNKQQLTIYEYIYYLDNIMAGESIKGAIYQVYKQLWDEEKKSSKELIENLQGKLIEVLNIIADEGFFIPEKGKVRTYSNQISREDLRRRR